MNPKTRRRLLAYADQLEQNGHTEKAESTRDYIARSNPHSNSQIIKTLRKALAAKPPRIKPLIQNRASAPTTNIPQPNNINMASEPRHSFDIEDISNEEKSAEPIVKSPNAIQLDIPPTPKFIPEEKTTSNNNAYALSAEIMSHLGVQFLHLLTSDQDIKITREDAEALGHFLLACVNHKRGDKVSFMGTASTLPCLGDVLIKNQHKLGEYTRKMYGIKNGVSAMEVGLTFIGFFPNSHPAQLVMTGSVAIARILDQYVSNLKNASPNKPLWTHIKPGETDAMRMFREMLTAGNDASFFKSILSTHSYVLQDGPDFTADQLHRLKSFNQNISIPSQLPTPVTELIKKQEYEKASKLSFEMLKSGTMAIETGKTLTGYLLNVLTRYDALDAEIYQEKQNQEKQQSEEKHNSSISMTRAF